jgi:hypothetical protein
MGLVIETMILPDFETASGTRDGALKRQKTGIVLFTQVQDSPGDETGNFEGPENREMEF